jgi:BRO1-like domain
LRNLWPAAPLPLTPLNPLALVSPTMLCPNLKGSANVDLQGHVTAHLSSKYPKSETDKFSSAVAHFAGLREAVTRMSTKQPAARECLLAYYVQLRDFEAKIPLEGVAPAKPLAFGWEDTFLSAPGMLLQSSVLYERCNLIFNLATLEASKACTVDRASKEGRNEASKGFCAAAGIFLFLRDALASK